MQTKIVGILNITPDSFSDGGKFFDIDLAIVGLKKMLEEGADVIDVGAESTRPNAASISLEEEWRRLEKILPQIILTIKKFNHDNKKQVIASIDSYRPIIAKKAKELGVDIINDVSGLADCEMIEFIAQNNIKTVLMHSLSVPANNNITIDPSLNVVQEILDFAQEKIKYLAKKGVKKSQLIFDPGIGFGKNAEQSIAILKDINQFHSLDLPIYIGHSKKSFLDKFVVKNLTNNQESRAQKTLIITKYLAQQKVSYIRVHDVLANKMQILG